MKKIPSLKYLLIPIIALATGAVLVVFSNPSNSVGTPVAPDAAQENVPAASYQPLHLTVNVDLTDEGFQPSTINIPSGQRVMLVVRNRGTNEHHYHISGLVPANMIWLQKESAPDIAADDMDAAEDSEHEDHHQALAAYHICTSGVCPTGASVHAHAVAGDKDVIIFTASNTGTFLVKDPLYPEILGEVTVY